MFSSLAYDHLLRFEEENIPFPPFIVALTAIEEQLTTYRQTGLAHHLLVLGESGTGKSTLCRLLTQKYPRQVLAERDVVPVLHVSAPAGATITSVASEILFVLGDPHPNVGSVAAKTRRIILLCRSCGVELILLDEAQHLHDRGQIATHYLVGDWIKRLIDDLGSPSVFLGLPRLQSLLNVNEQLRRRFSRRVMMALGQNPEVSIQAECFQLFISLVACFPVPIVYGDYGSGELGQRLYFASDGRVAYIKKLLHSALAQAHSVQLERVVPQDLEEAFTRDIWWEGIGKLNPFNPAFEFRRLDRAGEPFEQVDHRGRTKN